MMTANRVSDLLFFSRAVTFVLGAIAIGYGTLTFTFGASLWHGPSPVYGTALSVPYAPQSWGVVAIAAGLCVVVGQWIGQHRIIITGAVSMTLWFLFFAVSFFRDVIKSDLPFGAPGILIYGALCVLMVLRSVVHIPGRL